MVVYLCSHPTLTKGYGKLYIPFRFLLAQEYFRFFSQCNRAINQCFLLLVVLALPGAIVFIDKTIFLCLLLCEQSSCRQTNREKSAFSLIHFPFLVSKNRNCPLCHDYEWLQKMWSLQLLPTTPICYVMPPMRLYRWITSYLLLQLGP